jgi:hypothetical protein
MMKTIRDAIDEMLMSSIRTFRGIQRGEVVAGGELRLKFVQASEFFDFSIVSQDSKIANFPEEALRLLNGYYPSGTPQAGRMDKTSRIIFKADNLTSVFTFHDCKSGRSI